ncbi:hypothetical protein V8F33_014164 [Rhypophila sp. PSN 637]
MSTGRGGELIKPVILQFAWFQLVNDGSVISISIREEVPLPPAFATETRQMDVLALTQAGTARKHRLEALSSASTTSLSSFEDSEHHPSAKSRCVTAFDPLLIRAGHRLPLRATATDPRPIRTRCDHAPPPLEVFLPVTALRLPRSSSLLDLMDVDDAPTITSLPVPSTNDAQSREEAIRSIDGLP